MTVFAVVDGVLALRHIVVDAVGLDHPFNVRIAQSQRGQFGFDGFFLRRRVDGEFVIVELTIAVRVEGRDDISGVGTIFEVHSFEVYLTNRAGVAICVVIHPVEGSDQVIWRKQLLSIDVCAIEQNRFIPSDE